MTAHPRGASTASKARVLFCCLIGAFWLGLSSPSPAADYAPEDIVGQVVDAVSKRPLPGLTIELIGTHLSAVSNDQGVFAFTGVPRGKYALMIKHPGIAPDQFTIEVPAATRIQLPARSLPQVSETVNVTAAPWPAELLDTAQTTYSIGAEAVQARSGASLGDAVDELPGLRNISTGDAGGVPVIRGQTNERIRVLSDGIFHDYFQFSRRHMPNLETYEADRVEVLSGPASVLYGAQAVGGVINVVSSPLPFSTSDQPVFSGRSLLSYAGVNQAKTVHAQVEGGHRGLAARVSVTRRASGDMATPGGDLPNTDYTQQSASLEAGYRSENGIEARAFYRLWQNELGFFIPAQPDFRLGLRNEFGGCNVSLPSVWGIWSLDAAFSQNTRRAFPLGLSQGARVDLELDTQLYRVSFEHGRLTPLSRGVVRLERNQQSNATFGPVKLLPFFKNNTWSLLVFEEFPIPGRGEFDRWILNTGLRFDRRSLNVPAEPDLGIGEGFSKNYQALTGAVGVVYRFNRFLASGITVGRGWRNPSEFELFANGPHDGVQLFEKGNADLREETNLNTEFTLRLDHDRFKGSLALFRNQFSNFIYHRLTGESIDGLPVSTFDQCDAVIQGVEGSIKVDLARCLSVKIQAETLRTQNKETGSRLPFTPPKRAALSVQAHDLFSSRWFYPFIEFRSTWTAEGITSGPDEPFPLGTGPYLLFDIAAGVKRRLKNGIFRLDLWIGNLANKAYKDFLDTYKQYAQSAGRNTRLTIGFLF